MKLLIYMNRKSSLNEITVLNNSLCAKTWGAIITFFLKKTTKWSNEHITQVLFYLPIINNKIQSDQGNKVPNKLQ